MSQEGIYLRRASGLTRKISVFDALVYASAGPGPVFAFLYILWSPGLYPGADMRYATLTLLLLLPIMAVYYLFSVSMPRSGGEYVYVSRILHPSLGLFANWSLTIIGISWTGELTSWLVTYGIAPLIYNAGVLNGDQGLMNIGVQLNNPAYMPGWVIGVCSHRSSLPDSLAWCEACNACLLDRNSSQYCGPDRDTCCKSLLLSRHFS